MSMQEQELNRVINQLNPQPMSKAEADAKRTKAIEEYRKRFGFVQAPAPKKCTWIKLEPKATSLKKSLFKK